MTTEAKPNEEQPKPLDDAAILAKAKAGEQLTPEEEEHIAGNPNTEKRPDSEEAEDEAEEIEGEDKAEEEDPNAAPKPKEKKGEEEDPEDEEAEEEDEAADPKDPKAKKPAEPGKAAKQTPEEIAERRKLIEAELEKPDHLVDLSKYTQVEVGLYWELKKERRKRQKAENDTRTLQFREAQRKLKEDEEAEEAEAEEEDPFKDLGDDDVVTVKEAREAAAKKKAAKAKEKPAADKPILTVDQVRVQNVEADAKLRSKGIEDFFDVIQYAGTVFEGDPDIAEELRETAKSGGNVSEKAYWIIKGSPKWATVEAAITKEKGGKKKAAPDPDNAGRAERIKKNETKIKTTGKSGGGAVETGEYSVEEILRMTPAQFGRLPKKTQDAILNKYGSEPNYTV